MGGVEWIGLTVNSGASVPLALAELPMALATTHHEHHVGDTLRLSITAHQAAPMTPGLLGDLLTGAGFAPVAVRRLRAQPDAADTTIIEADASRARSLADTVAAGMNLLVCGLNPSEHAADAGVAFARAGNRFWPAALAADLVSRDRDPTHALRVHGIGMTDLVKRSTPRSAELSVEEYRRGSCRIHNLVALLAPSAICFVGLEGYRAARDRRARPGWQAEGLAGTPTYVMPSTSGLNARVSLDELAEHLRLAAVPPGPTRVTPLSSRDWNRGSHGTDGSMG